MSREMTVALFAKFSAAVMSSLPIDLSRNLATHWAVCSNKPRLQAELRRALGFLKVSDYFTPLDSNDIPRKYGDLPENAGLLAYQLEYPNHTILWRVRTGYTLERDPLAPDDDLDNPDLQDEPPTQDSIVLFIPRVVGHNLSGERQIAYLNSLFAKYNLPPVNGFGSASLVLGLIRSSEQKTDSSTGSCWVRTDSTSARTVPIVLRSVGETIEYQDRKLDSSARDVGVFPLIRFDL